MKKYEIRKNSIEVSEKNRKDIKEGITLISDNQEPEIVDSCDTLDEAKTKLKNYRSCISESSGGSGKYYFVEEFYIEENNYAEDGSFIEGGDVWEFSKFVIELVEKPSYETLATFDNMEAAEEAYNDYNGDNEVYLSF